jgi:hypothetical protein
LLHCPPFYSVAWLFMTCSACFICVVAIVGIASFLNPTYAPASWHFVLIFVRLSASHTPLTLRSRSLPPSRSGPSCLSPSSSTSASSPSSVSSTRSPRLSLSSSPSLPSPSYSECTRATSTRVNFAFSTRLLHSRLILFSSQPPSFSPSTSTEPDGTTKASSSSWAWSAAPTQFSVSTRSPILAKSVAASSLFPDPC